MNTEEKTPVNWRMQNVYEREGVNGESSHGSLERTLQKIRERKEKVEKLQSSDEPVVADGIITRVEEKIRSRIYGKGSPYNNDSDMMIYIEFDVIIDEKTFDSGFTAYTISDHPKSYLSRYIEKYTDLAEGANIKVQYQKEKTKWDIIL